MTYKLFSWLLFSWPIVVAVCKSKWRLNGMSKRSIKTEHCEQCSIINRINKASIYSVCIDYTCTIEEKIPNPTEVTIHKAHHWSPQQGKGAFTSRLLSARLITVTGKFRLPTSQLTQLTNRHSEFSNHSLESCTKKSRCNRTVRCYIIDIRRCT